MARSLVRLFLLLAAQFLIASDLGELRLLRGYADLMCERFGERVAIEWRIDDTLLDCPVPVMSMQPLLENIFKHTVERRPQAIRIVVCAMREARTLVAITLSAC